MSDYKKPRTNLNDFLPEQNRSAFLKNLNENLFNRFLTKDEFDHVVGIIGDADPNSPLKQIKESTAYRQAEQLQPIASVQVGSENNYLSFEDFLKRLSRLDVDTSKFAEWGRTLQFNYVPPVDIDKIINYQDYYWNADDINDLPDYITIKNQKNWALARSIEFKKAITKVQQGFPVVITDNHRLYIAGNALGSFSVGDSILLAAPNNVLSINVIQAISLNPATGRSEILLRDSIEGVIYTSIYNFEIVIRAINSDNSFTVDGDLTNIFTSGYVFLTLHDGAERNVLWTTVSATFSTSTNTTKIVVDKTIETNASYKKISLLPMASLADAEYKSVSGEGDINYNNPWDNTYLGSLVWFRDLPILSSGSGYSQLGDHGIYDNAFNFINMQIRPGDTLQLTNGPITGEYQIISVEQNFLGIDSSVRMFTKTTLQYNILRQTIYDYLISDVAPTFPNLYDLWVNSSNDTLNQWDGSEWKTVVENISILVAAAHQRYKLSLTQTDAWSVSNKWVHKNQLTSFSGKSRAQLPIIEFDPFLELTDTSYAQYEWKYRKLATDLYSTTIAQPSLFEISDITITNATNPEFIFVNARTLLLDKKFGNLTNDIAPGSRVRLTGFTNNTGLYYVDSVQFKQPTATSAFQTYIRLTENVPNPFDLKIGASVGPEKTSQGDTWAGFDKHWIFYGMTDITASSVSPTKNPMLDIFVKSYVDTTYNYETNVGLVWQTLSYLNDGNYGATVRFDDSLHSLVLYDDYQEGDIRVYLNGVRQYGNFQDIRSNINSDYVGAIVFDSNVVFNRGDAIRIELGEYTLEDIGRRALRLVTNTNLVDTTLPYDLVNITRYRKLEQDKQDKNTYPFFNVYDVEGNPKQIASRIFMFREDKSYDINSYILKRIVFDADTKDYGFVQELSDATTGELYSYKNFSQPNYPLQTIWKRGVNNEQYVPKQLSDGSWDIPNPWFYNINHELRTDINLTELYKHFSSIISLQKVPGVANSANINQIYLSDNINFGVGGTIKEHNNGLDLAVSSVFVNNVTPLLLIQFAHDQYINSYNYLQEEFTKNVVSYLTGNATLTDLSAIQSKVNDYLRDGFESNEKFDEWFGDSTTYNDTTRAGVKSWIATLPYLGLVKKSVPYTLFDAKRGVNSVACHDGHLQEVLIQPSVIQSFMINLSKAGVETQTVTSDSTAFPTANTGALIIRVNTTAKTRNVYRFSASGKWELVNFNQILATAILNIEQSLYDGCPTFDKLNYDFDSVTTDSRYISLNNTQFSVWAKANGIKSPLLNSSFAQNDAFTWNYEFTTIETDPVTGLPSYNSAASYQKLYSNLYGTSFPNLEPWKLQGYTDIPSWWLTTYSDDSGTRKWKSIMWTNIINGTVPAGNKLPDGKTTSTGVINQITKKFAYIPVNMDDTNTADGYAPDDLLPPYWNSANSNNPRVRTPFDANQEETVITPNVDYTFGDGNPNEWEWQTSAQGLYDKLIVAFKIDPITFMHDTFNGDNFRKINCLDVDATTKKVFSHKDTIFHGDLDSSGKVFYSNGLNQWYVQYNRYHGFDGEASEFKPVWKNWDTQLSYLFSSYIDTPSLSVDSQIFDITGKDYNVNVKKTYGFEDQWLDALNASVLSVPSKYAKTRDNGIGWTVQFDSTSQTGRNISFYGKENFDFRVVKNSNIFEIFSYNIADIGITAPKIYVTANYAETVQLDDLTGFVGVSQYTATVSINGVGYPLILTASNAATMADAIDTINTQLNNVGIAFVNNGNLAIQANGNINITDNGLFATLHANFSGFSNQINTGYEFDKYFDLSGNLTGVLYEGVKFTVSSSTQFDGEYTIKSVYYNIQDSITRIFVNESVTLTSGVKNGLIAPSSRRTLPEGWVAGTELYLTSDGMLPSPFDDMTPYYLIPLDSFRFKLSASKDAALKGAGAIAALTDSTAQQYVGRIQTTFKALGGANASNSWRVHFSDTRQIMNMAQPLYISGVQQMVDFISGYSDYLESIGFSTKTVDIANYDDQTGRQNSWQVEMEKFINWLYVITSSRQTDDLIYQVTPDFPNSRFLYDQNSVNIASTQAGIYQRVVLMSSEDGTLPEPFNNPLKQYIPYYVIQSNDGKGFQLAYTNADAASGKYITLGEPGVGSVYFKIYKDQAEYPEFALNPYKKAVSISHPQGILSDVISNDRKDILTNQKIYDQTGRAITHDMLMVLRRDESSQAFLTDSIVRANAIVVDPAYIAGMHVFIDGFEHVLVFNDYSVSNNLIYDSFLGLRTQRFFLEFNRSPNMTLRPNVGGFVVHNDDLMQNFESAVNDLRYMYDTYNVQESKLLTQRVRKSLGYDGQPEYMADLNINPKSSFIFHRGMIQNKGTNFSIDAFTNQTLFNGAELDEFWAYKLARFGDAKEKNYIEFKLTREDSIKKELRVEFVNPEENAFNSTFTTVSLADTTRWWDQPDVLDKMAPSKSFYFNTRVTSIVEHQESAIQLINGNYLLALDRASDGVIITYFDTITGTTKQMVNLTDYQLINAKTVKFTTKTVPTNYVNITVSCLTYDYNAHTPAVFVDKAAGVIVNQIAIWNPAFGQYNQYAYSLIDIKSANDPAIYEVDFTGVSNNYIWKEGKTDKVWLDLSEEAYLPYYDTGIYPNIDDRITNWGKLADFGSLTMYQWTESTVPPSLYVDTFPNTGTPKSNLYKNTGTQSAPVWVIQKPSQFDVITAFVDNSTTVPFTGTVNVYRNGKFDMVLDLTQVTLNQYAHGALIPNQTAKPSAQDYITLILPVATPTQDDLDNLVYKYDTPYSTSISVNETNGDEITYYYYWVTNKVNKITTTSNYTSTLRQAQKDLVNNPNPYMILSGLRYADDGFGVVFGNAFDANPYELPVRYSQLVIRGLKGLVSEDERYALRFTRDFTLRDRMPVNGDIYNYAASNGLTSPLGLKNVHFEWKLFREKQTQKIDLFLWEKLISSLVGYPVVNKVIDSSTRIPALDRILFDGIYGTDTQYGLGDEQIFVSSELGLGTIQAILNDPTQSFVNIDIDSFLDTYSFGTVNDIVTAMYAIYDNFNAANINYIFFATLNDAMSLKKTSSDIFKTSWVALDVSQNVLPGENNYNVDIVDVQPGGACDIDENIVVPTPPPLPSPSPTPSVTPTVTPSISMTVTPSVTATISFTPTQTQTPAPTGTPLATPTPTATPSPTLTTTPSVTATPDVTVTVTPTVTPTMTATITPTVTATISVSPTPSVTPSATYLPITDYDTAVQNSNALVYYKFDDINTTIAKDSSLYGRDGYYNGNITQDEDGLFPQSGRSVTFNSDYSQGNFVLNQYDTYLDLDGDFTIEVFANAVAADQASALPVLVYVPYDAQTFQPQFMLFIDTATNKYAFRIATTDQAFVEVQSDVDADGTAYMITCKREGNTIHMFIDGVEVSSATATGANLLAHTYGIALGGAPYSIPSVNNYIGGLDSFSLYGGALDDSDIRHHYEVISGILISPSPTPSPTPTPTPTPTITATVSPTPPVTPTVSLSLTPSTTRVISNAYATQVLADTPLVFYRMDDNVQNSVADSSGNNRHLTTTVNTTLLQPGLCNDNGLSYLMNAGYATGNIGTSFSGTNGVTFEAIIKTTGLSPTGQSMCISHLGDVTVINGSGVYWNLTNTGQLVINYMTPSGTTSVSTTNPVISNNEIAIISITLDVINNQTRFYKNGVLIQTGVAPGGTVGTGASTQFSIGTFYNTNSGNYVGNIDMVSAYRAVLTPARILAHAQAAGFA